MAGDRVEALLGALGEALARGEGVSRRPASTYRLQLRPGFGFAEAAAVVPYLDALGVSDVYLSPVLASAPGSTHGYDVVDHGRLDPELGGEAGYDALARACAERGMGLLLDYVPNHMGIGRWNAWWMDLLENGPASVHAPAFDVDWQPLKPELANRVLVPKLGGQFGVVLERAELRLVREGGTFSVHYHDHVFPLTPRSVPTVLRLRPDELQAAGDGDGDRLAELLSVCTALEKLAPRAEATPGAIEERSREKEVAKRRLAALFEASPRLRAHVDENVRLLNGTPGEPRSFDALQRLLDAQPWRLAFWRVAGEEINYRRFFDVNDLAAIRMEEPRVFGDAHRLVLALLREGKASGLRIDHPDGLYAPTAYFRRLQASHLVETARRLAAAGGEPLDAATEAALLDRVFAALERGDLPRRPLYVVVEKVLVVPERMPDGWDVDGTTGYDFLAAASGLFVDRDADRAFEGLWVRFTGRRERYEEVAAQAKRLVMSSSMASEVNVLAHRLSRISETDRRTRDFTLNELTRALVEYVSLFPVYRTYVTRRGEVSEPDRLRVERTIARARRRSPLVDPSIFDFLGDVILQRYPDGLSDAGKAAWLEFTLKLQQVTGPVTAKAVEDTAFYRHVPLLSANEVGGEPSRFGTAPDELHRLLAERLERYPGSLSATSTHDTKRSEDVRLRIAALTELPGDWRRAVARLSRAGRPHLTRLEGRVAPDRVDELLLYQTLAGAFPDEGLAPGTEAHGAFVERMRAYLLKAAKEAKRHTSWTSPDEEYEGALARFVERGLGSRPFLAELATLAGRLARAGRLSALALTAIKLAAPGVPDVYQGTELWDLSLVDPDNRRPVDFERRRAALAALDAEAGRGPAARVALARTVSAPDALPDGRAKLLLLRAGLHLRRRERDLLLRGAYVPLAAEGPLARHVFAFARVHEGRAALCAVPRLALRLAEEGGGAIRWEGRLVLPEGIPARLVDAVTGEPREGRALPLAALLGDFPVALLGPG
jgi:(1->4)-alpha-D-glucan 1-alpha-D-glucosylmutase